MAYRIEDKGPVFEVNMWGDISRWEVLEIIHHLKDKDPRKESHDLWIFTDIEGVHYDDFPEIVRAVASLCPPDMVGGKTALVASDGLLNAQLELYRSAAAGLPFEIGVFRTKDQALRWLTD